MTYDSPIKPTGGPAPTKQKEIHMSKRSPKVVNVTAQTIRAAYHTGALDAAKVVDAKGKAVPTGSLFGGPQGRGRGRLNPAHVEAFLAANPGTAYAEKVAEVKTVDLPMVSAKTGRPVKPVTVPLSEFRALSGQKMGKPSAASLQAASEAYVKRQQA